MKVTLMCNGWRSPVHITKLIGDSQKTVGIGTRLSGTVEGSPAEIAALKEGIKRGWTPEFWVTEVKE